MACREGAPLEWTPNTLVEQRLYHNTNKAEQTGRQIQPPLWDKDGNLQPHSPWMVHIILEDNSVNRKGTQVKLTHNLAHTHLQYTVHTSNALVIYGAAQKSTYQLHRDAEDTVYTVYTSAHYNVLPGPTWHQNPTWHQCLHGKRVPRKDGAKPTRNTTQGGGSTHAIIINWAPAKAGMALIHRGTQSLTTPPTAESGAPSDRPCTLTSTASKPPGSIRALLLSQRAGGSTAETPRISAG